MPQVVFLLYQLLIQVGIESFAELVSLFLGLVLFCWCVVASSGTTIVAIGSDQPTKQEIPVDVLASRKYVCDLVAQTSQIGELRSAIAAVRPATSPCA